ncbi:MAG: ABC transporter ATP-binding protein, partial [Bacilli bacterium]|nr:ABC transporter ATP-binding protein [Bacilli bacterium]
MKKLKEFKSLIQFAKEYKGKLILASILIFICELSEILTGYLNGSAVEAITNLKVERALIFLSIYLVIRLLADSILIVSANSMLQKVESAVTRKLGFYTYKKALELPAYAYEKTSSGEIINRITNDADTLSFSFGQLLEIFSSIVGSSILII